MFRMWEGVSLMKDKDDKIHLKEYEAYAEQLKKDIKAEPLKQYKYWLENRLKATENMIRYINNKNNG